MTTGNALTTQEKTVAITNLGSGTVGRSARWEVKLNGAGRTNSFSGTPPFVVIFRVNKGEPFDADGWVDACWDVKGDERDLEQNIGPNGQGFGPLASGGMQTFPAGFMIDYYETFSTSDYWWEGEDTEAKVWFEDGTYNLRVKKEEFAQHLKCEAATFRNFSLDIDATQKEGPNNNAYGVLFRYINSANFYWFVITGNGEIHFKKQEKGKWVNIKYISGNSGWQKCAQVKTGNSANHIRVVADRNKFTFYVNGEKVLEAKDSTFSGGSVGITVASLDAPTNKGPHFVFDNLIVTKRY